jgi:3'-phosphoadenosine 5'-phosphosulfate sulfotransferase (PAPS reductase)/FAD synthetase
VVPTVFRLEWPTEIRDALISFENPHGSITNSDLEMAGLLLLWLVMEEICPDLVHKHVALFSDNQPTVCWVKRMASRNSFIAKCILQIIALRLKIRQASPLTPQHIKGERHDCSYSRWCIDRWNGTEYPRRRCQDSRCLGAGSHG